MILSYLWEGKVYVMKTWLERFLHRSWETKPFLRENLKRYLKTEEKFGSKAS